MAGNGFKEVHVGKRINLMKKPYLFFGAGFILFIFCMNLVFSKLENDGEEKVSVNKSASIQKVNSSPVKNKRINKKKSIGGNGQRSFMKSGYDWCRGVGRVGVGKRDYKGVQGFTSTGNQITLKGPFVVVGFIGSGDDNIYLLQDSSHKVSRVRSKFKMYQVGQNICV